MDTRGIRSFLAQGSPTKNLSGGPNTHIWLQFWLLAFLWAGGPRSYLPYHHRRPFCGLAGRSYTTQSNDKYSEIQDHRCSFNAVRLILTQIDRPLFIVAHSLGGLVVANALSRPSGENTNIQRLLDATRGIMFFGTPFEGSSVARWGALIESFLGIFTDTNPKIIKSLKKNSGELMNINHQFEKFIYHRAKSEDCYTVDVATFFEAISLKVKGAKVGRIVEQESARIVGIDPIDIDADHREMCRFDDSERTGYMRASGKLANWINALDNTDSQSSRVGAPHCSTIAFAHSR